MPRILLRYLYGKDARTHLYWALLVGFALRSCSAFFVYGPQALDDYKHGVWPAYQYFAGQPVDLPEYRSYILVFLLSGFVKVASWFGVSSALGQVRAMYFGLALVSLLGIYGTYLFSRVWRSRVYAGLAIYLAAMFPLMPFVGTRAFGEAVAMSLVMLAFGILESNRARGPGRSSVRLWLLGFLVLGLATLFRFHCGLLYVAYLAILFLTKEGRGFAGGMAAGFITIIGQATVDAVSGKVPLSTLFIYLRENEGGAAKYGVSPWYNPLLFALVVMLAPFSLVMWRSFKPFWKREWPLLVPFLIFLAAHCAVAHKEERFLYPILGLELWMLAYLWTAHSFNRWARRIFLPFFVFVTALLLPIVCFVNTQEGEIEPPAIVGSEYGSVVYLDHKSLFGQSRFLFYLLRPPSTMEPVEIADMTLARVDETILKTPKVEAVVLVTSEPAAKSKLDELAKAKNANALCLDVRTSGSIIDRLLYRLNPKHNQRRRPTWYLVCEKR